MTFKRLLPISHSPTEINDNQSSFQSNTCKVCGEEAHIIHYGSLSCLSCRTFFRRNCFHPELVRPCDYGEQCEVSILTRKVCAACRLRKCFSVGMSKNLIRQEYSGDKKSSSKSTSSKRQATTGKEILPILQLPILNLLRNDQSLLSTSEWTLLSNVVHAFDRFSLISTLNQNFKNLSSTSSQIQFNIADALETVGSSFTSMQSFVNSTPDFQVLSINEQQSLLARNLNTSTSLSFGIFFRDTKLLDNAECCASYITLCGSELIQRLKYNINQLDLDSTLLRIMTLVIFFSSNGFIVDTHENMSNDSFLYSTFRLFGSQNVYVELLWKYMMYRYGYDETVIRFSRMVKCILDRINQSATVYMNNVILHDFVDEITEQTKETLTINQNEVVPLWGKTFPSS